MSHPTSFCPTGQKLGCITNFDVLFLVIVFQVTVNKTHFMLISCYYFVKYICTTQELYTHRAWLVELKLWVPHLQHLSFCSEAYHGSLFPSQGSPQCPHTSSTQLSRSIGPPGTCRQMNTVGCSDQLEASWVCHLDCWCQGHPCVVADILRNLEDGQDCNLE